MLLEPASGFVRQIRLGADTKSNRDSVKWGRPLLSRPASTLSSTSGGGEGRGEEAPNYIPPTCTEKWYELVLNGIYAAVRDRNWRTVEPVIRELHIDQGPDAFKVVFTAVCQQDEIDFVWRGTIAGDVAGTIRYTFEGEAKSDFLRNRIGFCVLHGANCAGRPAVVEHVDGSRTGAVFPSFISPQQPFKNVRAITHWIERGGDGGESAPAGIPREQSLLTSTATSGVEVRMEGEVFEMEDQRNWTDASFKTYGSPLKRPFPVEVKRGERFRQSVELRCLSEGRHSCRPVPLSDHLGDRNVALPPSTEFHPLPRLGLGMASHCLPLTEAEVERLRPLQLDHLRCELTPLAEGWDSRWHEAVRQARALDCRLHMALHFSEAGASRSLDHVRAQLKSVAEIARGTNLVDAWLIFSRGEQATSAQWTELAREQLAPCGGKIVGGTNAYFAELNRGRPEPGSADAITWSINPQVHAFDHLSLVETLDAQWETARSAREFFDGDLMISPVTLQPRFNPNATVEPPPVPPDVLPPQVDVRQMSLFGAAWTLGSIASLSRAPLLRSITYYETTGWRGVMEWAERPRLPHKFVTRPGWVLPAYFVFALLAGYDQCRFVSVADPLKQTALLVRRRSEPDLARLLVASFDRDVTKLNLPTGFVPFRCLALDLENAVAALREPALLLANGWVEVAAEASLSLSSLALMAVDGRLAIRR